MCLGMELHRIIEEGSDSDFKWICLHPTVIIQRDKWFLWMDFPLLLPYQTCTQARKKSSPLSVIPGDGFE